MPTSLIVQILFILALGAVLIRRKRAGRWKRPWSFPVAMALLGLSLALASLAMIMSRFDSGV